MKKYYKLSFRNERTSFYEAGDGDLIGYRGGTMNKTNFFTVDGKCRLVRSLYQCKEVAMAYQVASGDICIVRRDTWIKLKKS